MRIPILSQIVFLPLLAAVAVALVPKRFLRTLFLVGGLGMLAAWVRSLTLFFDFPADAVGFHFVERAAWIPAYGVTYSLGVDGMSVVLLLLTTTFSWLALLASYGTVNRRVKEFLVSLLFLESAMLGTFAALDLFLFYVFWEAVLIPMYFIIGIWGGERRVYATLKFFLYTMAGSVLMLLGILALLAIHREQVGFASTAMADLGRLALPAGSQVAFFLLFGAAFAVKIPLFPFHTWLPDAHVEAPTAGSVLLAAILLKMGAYGLLRIGLPFFPEAARLLAPYLGALGAVGIVYGACAAWAQEDMKNLVAYSSVSHMGFVALGIASLRPAAMSGAVFQMVAHGLSTGALFLLVGMLYERRHTRMLGDFGGLARVTPRLATAFLIAVLASIGLPGLCGFVGEFLILTGSFGAAPLVHSGAMVFAGVVGVVLGAAYMLGMYEKIFLGEVRFPENRWMPDLRLREALILVVPLLLAILLGLRPNAVLSKVDGAVAGIQAAMTEARP